MKEEEVAVVMKLVKKGKSVGLCTGRGMDGCGRTAVEWLRGVLRNVMETEHMLDEWKASTLISMLLKQR